MSLTGYTPHLGQAFRRPLQQPMAFARIAAPWLVLALTAPLVREAAVPGAALLGLGVNAVALGGFGFAWQRFIGGASASPLSPVARGLRLLMWIMAYQALQGFELFATILMNILLEGQDNAALLVKAGQQLFQILIGAMFLILPHLAMATSAEVRGTRLQEMVLASGIGVGFGYVLGYLPFMVLNELASQSLTGMVAQTIQAAVHFFSVVVMTGYFAIVWLDLRLSAPSPGAALAAAAPESAKAKGAARLNRGTKAKR